MTIIIIFLLILIVIFIVRQSNQSARIEHLSNLVERMGDELSYLNKTLKKGTSLLEKAEQSAKEQSIVNDNTEKIKPVIPPPAAQPTVTRPFVPEPLPVPPPPPVMKQESPQPLVVPKPDSAQKRLRKENMEEFIGGNLANKIGIGVLVLGIGFFVKYAIDKDWINELGRVSIGLCCGALLIGIAHGTRKKYRAFSSVLVGGGLSVLYFSIAFAFHQYHLIGQQAAFGIMLLTTSFAVVLSLYYSRQELAIIALLGGFATPFLASTGNDNYVALFTYLAILCAGMTALSWFRKWPAINVISMIGSALIFGGWLVDRTWWSPERVFPFRDGLFFATLFFVLFMGMHILNNIRTKRKFAALDYLLVIATQLFYFVAGITCLSYSGLVWKEGIFTLAVGLFNAVLGLSFFRSKSVDRNFSWLLIATSITQFTLFALLQLNGHEITLFWALEAILLLWMAIRTKFKLLLVASLNVQVLATVSIIVLWSSHYLLDPVTMPVVFNKVFVSSVVVAASLIVRSFLLRKHRTTDLSFLNESLRFSHTVHSITAIVILFLTGLFEIMHQFSMALPEAPVYMLYVQLYLVVACFIILALNRRSASYPILLIFTNIGTLAMVLLCTAANADLHRFLVQKNISFHFLAHWASLPFIFYHAYLLIQFFRSPQPAEWKAFQNMFAWVMSLGLIVFLSIELYQVNLALHLAREEDSPRWENLFYKAQLSILWGLYGFALIWQGLKYKFQPLRIISLLLLAITLLKLFLYDIRNIPPGGKIASFILLGVLLLLISFMYQRIKAIILQDEKREA